MSEGTQRKLAAIVSADVVGYSRLMGVDETGTLAALRGHREELIDPLIAKHGGRIVKTMGDGLLLEFPSVVDATQCVIEVQQGMAERNQDIETDQRIIFRIGINLGDIIIEGEDILGDGVNIAARLQEIAEPGGVAISGRVHDDVRDRLDAGFADIGEQSLKNIARPIRVWHWSPTASVATGPATSEAPLALPDKPSIAVLPFENMSHDPEQEYFADGMTEDLITDLSKLAGLSVIARNSSFAFKGRRVDVKDAARRLGVRNILEGSVRKMGARVRINAQLIDGASGSHVWADRYDGDLEDIFDLQDEILAKIVAALEVILTQQDSHRPKHRATANIDAYDLFLRGRTRFYALTPSALSEARDLFRQAIEIDEKFAEPYIFISFIHFSGWIFLWPDFSGDLADALSYAEKAVEIDGMSGRARANLGWMQLWTGQHDEAIANLERGVDLDPGNAESYAYFAETLNYAGEPERAVEMTRKALENDPMLPPNCQFHLGHSYYLLGKFDEAAEIISGALKIAPEFPPGHLVLAAVYAEMGRMDAAASEVGILSELAPAYSLEEVARLYPHRPPAVKERFLAALGKAGMRPN